MPDVSLSTKLDSVAQDASLGGASAAAAGNTGASTTNGFLRWIRDWMYARLGQLTSANSLSVVIASDATTKTIQCVIASDGVLLPVDSLEKTYTASGGVITSTSVSYGGETYVLTTSYSGGLPATDSQWVKQ